MANVTLLDPAQYEDQIEVYRICDDCGGTGQRQGPRPIMRGWCGTCQYPYEGGLEADQLRDGLIMPCGHHVERYETPVPLDFTCYLCSGSGRIRMLVNASAIRYAPKPASKRRKVPVVHVDAAAVGLTLTAADVTPTPKRVRAKKVAS